MENATSKERHHKHAKLERPKIGDWGRNEIAFTGAPCGIIKSLAKSVIQSLEDKWNVTYVDADHTSSDQANSADFVGNKLFTDKIHSRRLDFSTDPNVFERRTMLNDQDLVLVNGNHFSAKEQIVIKHPAKKESLQRKLDRLTNVRLVLAHADVISVNWDFLSGTIDKADVMGLEDHHSLADWFSDRMSANIPPVNALVLAGGKSQRMGHDKTQIDYHGKPQRDYLLALLENMQIPGYLSCRLDQTELFDQYDSFIPDAFEGLGPFGGILSAFRLHPNSAWLVLATDLPFIDKNAIGSILKNRDSSKIATAFHNAETGFPDPLMTLWEPKAYQVLLQFLAQGYSCPRKVLINSDIHCIKPENPDWLRNVNTPEELKNVRASLL